MMRVCNLDTCPMGICTQNPELRKRFKGKPEYIINYLTFVAEELREYMAKLGVRTVDELVGRTDLLQVKPSARRQPRRQDGSGLHPAQPRHRKPTSTAAKDVYDFHLEKTLDMKVLMKKFKLAARNPRASRWMFQHRPRLGCHLWQRDHPQVRQHLPDDVYTSTARLRRPELWRLHPQGPDAGTGGRLPTITWARACPAASSSSPARGHRLRARAKTSSSATWPSTAPPAARPSSPAWPASASACATPARWPLSRAWATTAAST